MTQITQMTRGHLARSATPPLEAGTKPMGVHLIERMPALAVRFSGVLGGSSVAAKNVLSDRDGFQVGRVYTGRIAAKVVKTQSTDWTDETFVGPAMSHDHPVICPEVAVSILVDLAPPEPALTGLTDLRHEPFVCRSESRLSRTAVASLARVMALAQAMPEGKGRASIDSAELPRWRLDSGKGALSATHSVVGATQIPCQERAFAPWYRTGAFHSVSVAQGVQ